MGPAKDDVEGDSSELTGQIIGAAIEVHRNLGPGYLEAVYEEALCHELSLRGIPYLRQAPFRVNYKGHAVGEGRVDLLVADAVVVELKSVDKIAPVHQAQLLSYLKATGKHLGLILNFDAAVMREGIKRMSL